MILPRLDEIPTRVDGLMVDSYQFHEPINSQLARTTATWLGQTTLMEHRRSDVKAKWHRSERLLLELLTPEQTADYQEHHAFITYGGTSKWPYLVTWNWQSNVMALPNGLHLCVVLARKRAVPLADFLVMQKLLLETHEERFIWTARGDLHSMMTYWERMNQS